MYRLGLDTNVLAYAEGVGDARRCARAIDIVQTLVPAAVVLPAQVLGELFNVLTRKGGASPEAAREAVLEWEGTFPVAGSDWTAFRSALELAAAHRLGMWDALILSVAADRRCDFLLTEDLQPGFEWRGVRVLDPFSSELP